MAERVAAALVGAVVALVGAAVLVGGRRWDERTRARTRQLERAVPVVAGRVDFAALAGLPAPVERYFRFALTDGMPIVTRAVVEHAGALNLTGAADGWKPLRSRQVFVPAAPGFVWDARVTMIPLVGVRVRDDYVHGTGTMRAAIAGVIPMASAHGGGELARGELIRYLGEAAWFPTALLPGQGVVWSAVDDSTASATLTDGAVAASLDFHFAPDGSVARVNAHDRPREVKDRYVPTPWSVTFAEYAERGGMRIPLAGEVRWHLPEGDLSYWRGRIERIEVTPSEAGR